MIESTLDTNIPCLFLPHLNGGSSKLLIYYHANAEDIGLCYEMLDHIRSTVRINIIAPEYPGYGVYNKIKKRTQVRIDQYELRDNAEHDEIITSAE